jgi:hypothetical protein
MAAMLVSHDVPFSVMCSAFQLPRAPPEYLNIKNAIGCLNVAADARMTAIQRARDQMDSLFGASGKKNVIIPQSQLSTLAPASELLGCISSYYPLLMELIVSVRADPECVHIKESVTIEWPSPLTGTSVRVKLTTIATGKHLLGALYVELCMLLVNRAFMLAEDARVTVGTICSPNSEFKRAADMLCRAAGILDFVANRIETEWSSDLSSLLTIEQRPLEVTPALCCGLRDVYIAQAQAMAVAQVILSFPPPHTQNLSTHYNTHVLSTFKRTTQINIGNCKW